LSDFQMTLAQIIGSIKDLDTVWLEKARERTGRLVMPPRALGRLHDISERLCAIQQSTKPMITPKAIVVMAGDHGVATEGVSAYPQEVTGEMIKTFINGGAGINVIARHVGADIQVVDMGVVAALDPEQLQAGDRLLIRKIAKGTSSIANGPAMSRDDAETAIMTGFQVATHLFDSGTQLLGTGDMGIGNTTPSAAIGKVVTGCTLDEMVGRGTGVDDLGLKRKKTIIKNAIEINQPDPTDGIDILAKIGGFEIGGITGCILAGAYYQRPVVIDGFISTAGALIAGVLAPLSMAYVFAGHRSEEPGHRCMLEYLKLSPILDLGMRLGEGTGGALAMNIMEGAIKIFKEMHTFEEAGVTDKE
jgi:nicotinate-nucleotide--dimethylbenzimidazole phosphoribosyltransferase